MNCIKLMRVQYLNFVVMVMKPLDLYK